VSEREYGKRSSKLTHEQVDYGEGLPQAHCSICKHGHMSRPHDRCDLVEDPIDPEKWCKLFRRRK